MTTTIPFYGGFAFRGGNKAKNDLYTGPARSLSVDTETKELRMHDGSTPGGFPVRASATNLMVFDPAVAANLGTVAENSVVNVSCRAYSCYQGVSITYSLLSGTLPPGLSLTSDGRIAGTIPNLEAGAVYTFTIRASDGVNNVSKQFTMTVSATNEVPAWTTSAGSLGTFGSANISVQLAATDPEGHALTYSLISGALPTGCTLSAAGLISGTNPMNGTTYNFTLGVSDGTNVVTRSFSITASSPVGEAVFTTPGTYQWTCPANVTSVCVVAVGGGQGGTYGDSGSNTGGSGGSLAYMNNMPVTPGVAYTLVVGSGSVGASAANTSPSSGNESKITTDSLTKCLAKGGGASGSVGTATFAGGVGKFGTGSQYGSGAGAGGYSGTGGNAVAGSTNGIAGTGGAGGSGAGGNGGGGSLGGAGGGGVGLYGQGTNGGGGTQSGSNASGGGGGSGGTNGANTTGASAGGNSYGGAGGLYGGGGGNAISGSGAWAGGTGGNGALRIIWGSGRSFPSNAA